MLFLAVMIRFAPPIVAALSLFAPAHCFMVGVPGLAKTLMVSTLAKVLSLSFKRIQFTPDRLVSGDYEIAISMRGGNEHTLFVTVEDE